MQLHALFRTEKHSPVVNLERSGWVMEDRLLDRHRRQKENSKDKQGSYYFLQAIKILNRGKVRKVFFISIPVSK